MPDHLALSHAFDLSEDREIIAFVGAGGKTTWMMALAKSLKRRVIVTTTTRLFADQVEMAAVTLPAMICRYPDFEAAVKAGGEYSKFILTGGRDGEKIKGISPEIPARLLRECDVNFVLVEADGAKMKAIKAPADHEPVIPPQTTLVVPLVGMDVLDQPIAEAAHRPRLLASLLGKSLADRLEPADIALLLKHPDGGFKSIPHGARVIPIINKVENEAQLPAARLIAKSVLEKPAVRQVILGRSAANARIAEVQRRVTAVVLAAGQSKRMGRLKTTLPWGMTTVLGQTIRNLQESAVHDILVVSGYRAQQIEAIAQEAGVSTVHNPDYARGEMLSSLQTAVAGLPANCTAVLVMLADQPMVGPLVIDQLLAAYWRGDETLIAPVYGGKRGNPVLISRQHFSELSALPPGSAPRELLKRHPVHLVALNSDSVLQDLDSPQDYDRHRPE